MRRRRRGDAAIPHQTLKHAIENILHNPHGTRNRIAELAHIVKTQHWIERARITRLNGLIRCKAHSKENIFFTSIYHIIPHSTGLSGLISHSRGLNGLIGCKAHSTGLSGLVHYNR